jgi:hypothetical protein
VKFTDEELLALTGSRTTEVTVAVLPMLSPFETVHSSLATIVIVAEAPDASELNVMLRLLPEPLQTPLAVEPQDTKDSDAGKLSVTDIVEAGSGPLFERVIVYATLLPAVMVGDEDVLVIVRSAAP